MTSTDQNFLDIPIKQIVPPELEARFDTNDPELRILADSINAVGLMQPIVVTRDGDQYRIVAGGRRLRACKLLGWETIPAHVMDFGHETSAGATLIENLQRQSLSPLEEAAALESMLQTYGLSQTKLAELVNQDRTWVSHRLALLRLPDDLLDAMQINDVAPSIALELARVTDRESRDYYASMVVNSGASLAVVREWVRSWLAFQNRQEEEPEPKAPEAPVPTVPASPPPTCLCCGGHPPLKPLKMVYLCWECANALAQASEKA